MSSVAASGVDPVHKSASPDREFKRPTLILTAELALFLLGVFLGHHWLH